MGRWGLGLPILLVVGCTTAAQHHQTLPATTERDMTLGLVQKEIRVGMSQADVAASLGSPNMVTRDTTGLETWVYDKIATEASYSTSEAYGTVLLLGFSRSSGAASTTQRTLTVVIRFDERGLVKLLTYHASKF